MNESSSGQSKKIPFEKLASTIHSQTEHLKAKYPGKKIDFDVVVKDGKTMLKPVIK